MNRPADAGALAYHMGCCDQYCLSTSESSWLMRASHNDGFGDGFNGRAVRSSWCGSWAFRQPVAGGSTAPAAFRRNRAQSVGPARALLFTRRFITDPEHALLSAPHALVPGVTLLGDRCSDPQTQPVDGAQSGYFIAGSMVRLPYLLTKADGFVDQSGQHKRNLLQRQGSGRVGISAFITRGPGTDGTAGVSRPAKATTAGARRDPYPLKATRIARNP